MGDTQSVAVVTWLYSKGIEYSKAVVKVKHLPDFELTRQKVL